MASTLDGSSKSADKPEMTGGGGGGGSGSIESRLASITSKNGFLGHVFDTSDPSKGEILNVCQYALLSLLPVVMLNKLMTRIIPDADPEASSIELVTEITMQITIIFVGMIIIHRAVTFVPTWSQYRYEPFILTNSILVFLVIVLSLNTKLGLKCSIMWDRAMDWMGWNSDASDDSADGGKKSTQKRKWSSSSGGGAHNSSQADSLLSNGGGGVGLGGFPPIPVSTTGGAGSKPQGLEALLPSFGGGGGGGSGGSGGGSSAGSFGGGISAFDPIGAGGSALQAANAVLGSAFN